MKTILHLCANIDSDSRYYQLDDNYRVIMVGKDVGVENFSYTGEVQGVIANPPCTELSRARTGGKARDVDAGMVLVNECLRIIAEVKPVWWVIENPATGALNTKLGKPRYTYQPWQYGNPWTKHTTLWGNFNIPAPLITDFDDVEHNPNLYKREGRRIVGLYQLHRAAIRHMPMYDWCADKIKTSADLRSLCSDGFAKAFYLANKNNCKIYLT